MGGSKRFGHLVGSFRRRYQRLFGKGRMLVRTQRLDADRALSEFILGGKNGKFGAGSISLFHLALDARLARMRHHTNAAVAHGFSEQHGLGL